MVDRGTLRKEAYRYIVRVLSTLPSSSDGKQCEGCVELEELQSLKQGLSDPSPALVAFLEDLLEGAIGRSEIRKHLMMPFGEPQTK